jgi:hypothetical protein
VGVGVAAGSVDIGVAAGDGFGFAACVGFSVAAGVGSGVAGKTESIAFPTERQRVIKT